MLNAIKTEDQRTTVEIGMDCIMPRIEIANDILYDAWEEFFGNVPQPSISALEAERLGRILYAAFDMTSNAIREYHLMLGHYDLDNPMPTTVPTPGVTIEPITAPSSAHSTTINSERSCD